MSDLEPVGKKRIIVPPSTTKRFGFKHVEEDTFYVGPNATPVYIPGYSAGLYSEAQIDELLEWQREQEEAAHKKSLAREKATKNVTADDYKELQEALQARLKWEDDRKKARGELPSKQEDVL